MSYVVPRRKPNKHAMLRALRAERLVLERQLRELDEQLDRLNEFRNTLEGRDGVEQAGKLYCEREEEFHNVLPYSVLRYYNPHTN